MKKLILLLFIPLVFACGNDSKKEEEKKISTAQEVIEYYPNGTVMVKANFLGNKLHGETIFYYPSGAVKSKINYVDGKYHGENIEYYENGAVKSVKKYKNDELIKD